MPTVELDELAIPADVVRLVSADLARKHRVIPINRTDSTILVAMSDPSNIFAIDDLHFETGLTIEVALAREEAIERALTRYYS